MDRQQVPESVPQTKLPELRLKRSLGKGKKSLVIKCLPNAITILADEMGTTLREYTDCLQGKSTKKTIVLEYDGKIDNRSLVKLVGFDEDLPELSIPQYLLANGVNHDIIEQLIDEFELGNHLFLLCSQLSKTVARQVQLLAAVASDAAIIVLNDPFQPFSGRWREVFGEYIYNDCTKANRVYVCSNLSFIPNSWIGKSNVSSYDVGIIFEKAKLKEIEPTKSVTKEAVKRQNINELNEKYYKPSFKISVPIPDSVINASKSVQEVIVRNLSSTGAFLREWTTPIFFGAFAIIAVIAGVILSYDLGGSRGKLQMVIQKIFLQNEQTVTNTSQVKTDKKQSASDSQEKTDEIPSEEILDAEDNLVDPEVKLALDTESLKMIFITLGIPWENSKMTLNE